jgi:Spy/CpxP family protein refolding chaperone
MEIPMITTRVLKIAGVITAIAMMLLITTVYAANNGGGHRGRGMGMPGERIERMADELNLSDAQKSQIKAIQEQFKTRNASTFEELKTLHETARQQMKDKNTEGAQATRDQIKAKMETLKAAGEQMSSQIRNVLTADQQAKFDEMKQNHKGERGECGGRHGKSGDRGNKGQGETGRTPMNQNGQGTLK